MSVAKLPPSCVGFLLSLSQLVQWFSDSGLWLVESDHMTWIMVSDWSMILSTLQREAQGETFFHRAEWSSIKNRSYELKIAYLNLRFFNLSSSIGTQMSNFWAIFCSIRPFFFRSFLPERLQLPDLMQVVGEVWTRAWGLQSSDQTTEKHN